MICGDAASIRTLKKRSAARGMLSGDTPGKPLSEVVRAHAKGSARGMLSGDKAKEPLSEVFRAHAKEPARGIQGVHCFMLASLASLASLAATAKFVEQQRQPGAHA